MDSYAADSGEPEWANYALEWAKYAKEYKELFRDNMVRYLGPKALLHLHYANSYHRCSNCWLEGSTVAFNYLQVLHYTQPPFWGILCLG